MKSSYALIISTIMLIAFIGWYFRYDVSESVQGTLVHDRLKNKVYDCYLILIDSNDCEAVYSLP